MNPIEDGFDDELTLTVELARAVGSPFEMLCLPTGTFSGVVPTTVEAGVIPKPRVGSAEIFGSLGPSRTKTLLAASDELEGAVTAWTAIVFEKSARCQGVPRIPLTRVAPDSSRCGTTPYAIGESGSNPGFMQSAKLISSSVHSRSSVQPVGVAPGKLMSSICSGWAVAA